MDKKNITNIKINSNILAELRDFKDLLTNPTLAILSTISSNGFPHSTPVWFDFDGQNFILNTMKKFKKARNMKENPFINLLIYNPIDPSRFVEVRGKVISITEEKAIEHLNSLTFKYTGKNHYFGDIIPKHFQETEIPAIYIVKPIKIVTEPTMEVI